jgi:hypothetical protein
MRACCRIGLFLTLLPLFSGCGRCGADYRDVVAWSTNSPGDSVRVALHQARGAPGTVLWTIYRNLSPGEVDPYPYEEHVLAAQLLDGGANMAVLLELPVDVELIARYGLAGAGGETYFNGPTSSYD